MSTVANLTINAEDLGDVNKNATTCRVAGTNNYKITFNSTYLNSATDLSIARTFIHEVLHANLLFQVKKRAGDDFDELYQIWNNMKDNPERDKEYQHEFMTGIKNIIARNLYEYCRRSSLSISPHYCYYLAWGGLEKTAAFKKLSYNERIKIHNYLTNEKDANNQAKGKECY